MHETVAVVPTLGRSPSLLECLVALRRQGGPELAVVLVAQGTDVPEVPSGLVDRVIECPKALGFSRATNLGARALDSELVATVNDDAIVEEGWLDALRDGLSRDDRVAAVQGANLLLHQPKLLDGRGLGWNRWWQAVQIDHGVEYGSGGVPGEVFGVSATAALYRRRTLLQVALDPGALFDGDLDSYYEDVDLACRLRTAGFRALHVPAARARHAGSVTGGTQRLSLIYGNRYLVLARFLGWTFWLRLPILLVRDSLDALSLREGHRPGPVRAILQGWNRAARHLGDYGHFGPPGLPVSEVRRLATAVHPSEVRAS